jgi:hypothetical protein
MAECGVAAMVNSAAHHQAAESKNGPLEVRTVRGIDRWQGERILDELDRAMLARDSEDYAQSAASVTAAVGRP